MLVTDDAKYYFDNFLTNAQQQTWQGLTNREIPELILDRLLVSDIPGDVEAAGLILDIIRLCPEEAYEEVRISLFQTLFTGQDTPYLSQLKKIHEICQNGKGAVFFACASTKKIGYYPLPQLSALIEAFYAVHQRIVVSADEFSCYDEGGKEELARLQDGGNPRRRAAPEQNPLDAPPPVRWRELLRVNGSVENMKAQAIRYLSSLPANQRLPMDQYSQFFAQIMTQTEIGKSEKIALIKLVVALSSDAAPNALASLTKEHVNELVQKTKRVHTHCGEEVFVSFCESALNRDHLAFDPIVRVLHFLSVFHEEFTSIRFAEEALRDYCENEVTLVGLLERFEERMPDTGLIALSQESDLDALIGRFSGQDPYVSQSLSPAQLEKIREQYGKIKEYCDAWKQLQIGQLVAKGQVLREGALGRPLEEDELLQLMAVGRLAIRIKFGIYPYHTQMIAVLGLLSYDSSCVAQMKTGEGKSTVVTLLAFIKAMQNQSVHIISSSPSLAIRDAEKYQSFFSAFGVSTNHICRLRREQEHFQADLLYGTATDFEFAIMEEMIGNTTLFREEKGEGKRFQNVIVDELDNLTIDTALNGARISTIDEESTTGWVYSPILQYVRGNRGNRAVGPLRAYLHTYLNGKFSDEVENLSDEQLQRWLESANAALYQRNQNEDYIIQRRRSLRGEEKELVLIIDKDNTGRIMHGMRWGQGVHEFVELNHGIDAEKESLIPLHISHPVFYPMYRTLFGLTGTLGSELEREEIASIYDVQMFDVPTHRPPRREDQPPQIYPSTFTLHHEVVNHVQQCRTEMRPLLILCETIRETQEIGSLLRNRNIPYELLNEVQEKSESEVLEKAGKPGAITIATNTAGRGTDIELTEESKENGGLMVVMTFYPNSLRVEMQARGRAGRQGNPGDSEILLSAEQLGVDLTQNFSDPAVQRNLRQELQEKREACGHKSRIMHECVANFDRHLFRLAQDFFARVNKALEAMKSPSFVKDRSSVLQYRKLLENKQAAQGLKVKDRALANQALQLLHQDRDQLVHWKTLLKQAADRLHDRLQRTWAIDFYQEVERIGHHSRFGQHAQVQTGVANIQQTLAQAELGPGMDFDQIVAVQNFVRDSVRILEELCQRDLQQLKEHVNARYEQIIQRAQAYISPTGEGVLNYLREITTAQLPAVSPDLQALVPMEG